MTGGGRSDGDGDGAARDPLGWDADAIGSDDFGPELIAALPELAADDAADHIASATADLDDQAPDGTTALVPDSPPLTLAYVESLLDTRRNEVQISPTLDRITALLDVLGNPQRSYPVILIAGTNGKSSTARMIDALLTRFGLRTGRFTSPHLQSVTERIALDGEPISADRYVQAYEDLAPFVEIVDQGSARSGGVPLSKFEILTAMAYAVFADTPVDVAVVEVGLGGTWDSTNVADAAVAVITPVGIDHTEFLGSTLTQIATNKAGIVKADSVAIIGPQEPDAMTAILESPTVTLPLTLLVDRRRTHSLSKATVEGFNRFFTEHQHALSGGRCAIVLSSGVYFEIAEMVRTVLRIPNTSIRTFQDYDEALAWLVRGSESRSQK